MTYRIFWQVQQQVLCVELAGDLSLDDFNRINGEVINHLGDEPTTKYRDVTLLVDITRPSSTPRVFEQLKQSQTYVFRRDLKFILVAGSNKFMRLMMLLTFNLCRPSLKFFDDVDHALKYVQMVSPLNE